MLLQHPKNKLLRVDFFHLSPPEIITLVNFILTGYFVGLFELLLFAEAQTCCDEMRIAFCIKPTHGALEKIKFISVMRK